MSVLVIVHKYGIKYSTEQCSDNLPILPPDQTTVTALMLPLKGAQNRVLKFIIIINFIRS